MHFVLSFLRVEDLSHSECPPPFPNVCAFVSTCGANIPIVAWCWCRAFCVVFLSVEDVLHRGGILRVGDVLHCGGILRVEDVLHCGGIFAR